MPDTQAASRTPIDPRHPIELTCQDLDGAIAFYTETLGFRLDMIMPADAPRIAELSGHGLKLRLECDPDADPNAPSQHGDGMQQRGADSQYPGNEWVQGRAGMQYRDLLPGRMGGAVIASHIRIVDGGPVPDYVHYHEIGFQMIFCRRGWARVVYEDQGPAFVIQAGDCVLQPPTIRHRVLESSSGLEVVEIGCPAEHATRRDHDLQLPTPQLRPDREFKGQRFVRHVASDAEWQASAHPHFDCRDTGIDTATGGLASVCVLRCRKRPGQARAASALVRTDRQMLLMVLAGSLRLDGSRRLDVDDCCLVPANADYTLEADDGCEALQVMLPLMA